MRGYLLESSRGAERQRAWRSDISKWLDVVSRQAIADHDRLAGIKVHTGVMVRTDAADMCVFRRTQENL
jgi:hypothetical protein